MEVVAEESNVKLEIPADIKLEDSDTEQEVDNEIPRNMNEVETRPQIKQEVESGVYSVRRENVHDYVQDIEPGFQQDASEDVRIKQEVDEETDIKQEGDYEFIDGTDNIKQEATIPPTITEPVTIAVHRKFMEESGNFIVQKVSHTYARSKKTKTCVDDSFNTQSKNGGNTDGSRPNEVKKMIILDENSLQDMNPAQSSDTQIDLPEPASQGLSENEVSAGLKQVREYSCNVCLFKSRSKCKLDYHYYCAHPDVHDRYKCAKCDFTTNRRDHLKQHCMMKHICQHKCTFENCKKVFLSRCALQIHMNIHLGVKDYQCSHCDYKAVTKQHIKLHEVRHQNVANYQCDKCGKQFKGHHSLLLHIDRLHSEVDSEYRCGECDFVTNRKEKLRRHKMRKHIRKHKCEYDSCKLAFSVPAGLKEHMNNHLGVKPYQCSQCDFRAARRWKIKCHELRHHARIHSGEKPYLCDTCGYRSWYPTILTNHKCRGVQLRLFKFGTVPGQIIPIHSGPDNIRLL